MTCLYEIVSTVKAIHMRRRRLLFMLVMDEESHYYILTPPESCLVLLLLAAAAVLGQISSLKPKDLKIAANVLLLLKVYLLFS